MNLDPGGNNPIFDKNMMALRAFYPIFLKQLDRVPENPWPDSMFKFDFEEGRKGHPTFAIVAPDGRRIYGHSTFDPFKEFGKKLEGVEFEERGRIIVIGFGFGYHIEELLDRTESQTIIVVEPFPTLLREAFATRDLTKVLTSGRVIITVSLEPGDLSFVLSAGLSPINLPEFKTYMLPYSNLVPTASEKIYKAIDNMKSHMLFNMFTGLYGGSQFWENAIKNFSFSYRNPGLLSFKSMFSGKPVFVIAPGPSLERNVLQLKRVAGKALIIAVDTATRILHKYGIEPDIIATIDYQQENFNKLKDVDTTNSYLFPAIEVYPEIPKRHKGKAIAYYHTRATCELYDPILGEKGSIGTGGSVLTDAVNLAIYLGATPMILMGVDLGFPGNRWYADGSFEGGEFTRQLRDGEIETMDVTDIYGNRLVTYGSFYAFLNYLDTTFQRAEIPVIDATEGGASIMYTETMTAEDAIETYCADPYDPKGMLDEVHDSYEPPPLEEVSDKLQKMMKKYKTLLKHTGRGLKKSDEALLHVEDLDKSEKAKRNFVASLDKMQTAKLQMKKMGEEIEFLVPLLERSMIGVFQHNIDDIKDKSKTITEKKPAYRRVVELDKSLFSSINSAAETLLEHFEKIKIELEGCA